MITRMTDYDCAAHVAGVGLNFGVLGDEYAAAKAAVEYDRHSLFEGYAEPLPEDRALIRTASERLNASASLS